MKSLSERRIAAEDRLNEIEDEVEALAQNGKAGENRDKIRGLLDEYDAILPVWKNLEELETNNSRMDVFETLAEAVKPII